MKERQQLAIVIPAYKGLYLEQALASITNQTSHQFTLYVGDDRSPDDLYSIVKQFQSRIPIVYHRFDDNVGGKNLISQWERCIGLTRGEDWIWLFSDDDILDPTCVETFHKNVVHYSKEHLFHFNVKRIGANNEILGTYQPFPEHLTADAFFSDKIRHKVFSFVVEYIFSRETYLRCHGFVHFDLAWGSDDATWIKFAVARGIITLQDSYVYWRQSGINISSITEDKAILLRKINASEAYLQWVKNFFKQKKVKDTTTDYQKSKWILDQFIHSRALTFDEKMAISNGVLNRLGYNSVVLNVKFYIVYMTLKKLLKRK